jgi:hypothetical protein
MQNRKLSTVLIAALILCACSVSQLSVSLAVVSDATEAATLAVPILESTGVLPTGIGNIIIAYAQSVSTAASQSSAELLTSDSAAVKAEKITGFFANVAVPALGSTVGPEVQAIVQAISSAVNLFLSQFNSPSAKLAIKTGVADKYKMSSGDRHAIGGLQKKFAATAVKCQSLMKK